MLLPPGLEARSSRSTGMWCVRRVLVVVRPARPVPITMVWGVIWFLCFLMGGDDDMGWYGSGL